MVKVQKYTMNGIFQKYTFKLRKGAKIIDAASQDDKLVLWALIDTDKPVEERSFIAVTTGDDIREYQLNELVPIGACIDKDGWVGHIFEIIPR
jgi:hypothetical protein